MDENDDPKGPRVLDVLLAFGTRPKMKVPEIADLVGLPQSTTYRFVRTLRDRGLLSASGDGLYAIGPRLLQLASSATSQSRVLDFAIPSMKALAEETGETILLSKLVGDKAMAIHQEPGRLPLRLTFEVGLTRPLHAGASSKILFAYLAEPLRERLLKAGGFQRQTLQTTTDPDVLRTQLAKIRRDGYAVTSDEWEEHVLAIATPIFEPGEAPWGLSLVAPSVRIPKKRLGELIGRVVASARDISVRLGVWNTTSSEPAAGRPDGNDVDA
jgi:DNA-binding IclR family transcriptional regulator